MARPGLTGVLLVGGASRRFGSPKALAKFRGVTLAERGWETLGLYCGERFAVGKVADRLDLPFPVRDDGTDVRAPIAGVVAGLRSASNDVCFFLPVDCILVELGLIQELEAAVADVDAAVTQTGPLPGAFRKRALDVLERRLERRWLALREALDELETNVVECDPGEVINVNTPDDLRSLR